MTHTLMLLSDRLGADRSARCAEEKADEETAACLSPASTKISAFDVSQPSISRRTSNGVLRSIWTVLFKAKINLLLPSGPAAILLHYLTQKHVRI